MIKTSYIVAEGCLPFSSCAVCVCDQVWAMWANKDLFLKSVMKDWKNAFCKDPEEEKKNKLRCVADYLTKTDLV
jgi:hypothetical protein